MCVCVCLCVCASVCVRVCVCVYVFASLNFVVLSQGEARPESAIFFGMQKPCREQVRETETERDK